MTSKKAHSEAVLSDLRDGWWHEDFLNLISERLELRPLESLLDVGCGLGHWGQRILPLMAEGASLAGIDQEQRWVDHASERAKQLGFGERTRYQVAGASALPFEDDRFDLVTCQTLLMHVSSPQAVLDEMLRVLRPGGRLLLSEPSNIANQFSSDTVQRAMTPREVAEFAQLLVACSRGRANLGRGDDSVADVLPQLLSSAGMKQIKVFQNDRCNVTQAPYSDAVRAQLEEEIGHVEKKFWLWNKEDARDLYEAGGGEKRAFERLYKTFLRRSQLFETQVRAGTYARTGGSFHYLISACSELV